ncbi:MAG: hypothetical protein WC767_02995 [Candidatus Paceibacterota bacterium]|jgi:hypothetical protein
MNSLTTPLGLEGLLSLRIDVASGTATFDLENIATGNPTGLARKICSAFGSPTCDIVLIPDTVSAKYHFTLANVVEDPRTLLKSAKTKLIELIALMDRFSL